MYIFCICNIWNVLTSVAASTDNGTAINIPQITVIMGATSVYASTLLIMTVG